MGLHKPHELSHHNLRSPDALHSNQQKCAGRRRKKEGDEPRGITYAGPINRSIVQVGQKVLNYWRVETYKQVEPSKCQLEAQLSVNNSVDNLIKLPITPLSACSS
jgi:hypothetical protein